MLDGQRFEDFARIGADWFWETDRDGRFAYFSDSTAQLGYRLSTYIGRTRGELAVADAENLARLAALDKIIAARQPFRDVIYQFDPGTGGRRWCAISADPMFDATGAFAGYRGVGRDVTALVDARTELETKSRALDAILAAIPDGVQVIGTGGTTLAVNDRIYEIMDVPNRRGHPGGSSIYESLVDMARRGEYGPGDPKTLARERIEVIAKALNEQKHVAYQRQLKTGRWVEVRLRRVDGGGMLSLYRDITEAKEREADLERQAALLATIISNIDGGILVVDKDSRLSAWNDRFVGLIGADPSIVQRGAPLRELLLSQARSGEFGPCDPQAEADRRVAIFHSDRPRVTERARPDGRILEVRRRPVPGGGSVSFYIDITERRRAAQELQELNATLEKRVLERTEALAEAERFQRSLVASMPGMVYRCRNDGNWTMEFASEGSRDLLGMTPDELVDGTVVYRDLVHPDDRDARRQKWQEALAAGRTFEAEYRLRHRDGSWRWIHDRAHGVRDVSGAVLRLEGLVMDITARKEAEGDRERARANLVDALESLDHSLILYDRDDRLVLFNPHLDIDYPDADQYLVPGQTFEAIFRNMVDAGRITVPPDRAKEEYIAERVAIHRAADGSTIERILADGRVLHVVERPSRSGGIVATGRDVTERLKMERHLREAQRMEAIGQLTGGLAHDLNNYLSVIMGNLDLLADRPSSDPQTPRLIEGALAGARRGAELTRSLLAFSRRQPLAPKVLDVGERIGDIARLLRRTIGEKIALDLQVAPGLWPVRIDGAQLDSAIVNLANNARDAMPDGGKLSIALRNTPQGPVGQPAGDYVLIEVIDTGAGMDARTLARAFEPFFSTKGPGHGTGLGLSMVHGFVHQSGGTIGLASTPGTGTTVSIFLPRASAPVPRTAAPAKGSTKPPRGTERILLVEDNDDVRESVAEQLVSLGYRVAEAASGDAALAALDADTGFDLVVSDLVMPGKVDGLALAGIVRERWPKLRILLTSGFAGDVGDAADRTQSSFPILRKPYRKVDLAGALRAALAGEMVNEQAG